MEATATPTVSAATGRDGSEPLPLSVAMEELQSALKAGHDEQVSLWGSRLENGVVDGGQAHVQLCEAGGLALDAGQFETAERFAKRSLLAFPKYGHVYRLLGEMFKRQGKPKSAAPCYRYVLPEEICKRWFDESDCTLITSQCVDGAGLERLTAFPEERHSLKPPVQSNPVSVQDLDHDVLLSAEAFVGVVPGGRLWYDGGNATVWDRQGRIVEDLGMGFAPLVHASVAERTPVRLKGRVCLLGNRSWLNYYHWMCDAMPRLDVLEASGIALESIDHFVTMSPRHPFHEDSLALAGIGKERLHTTAQGEYVEADEILVPVFGSNSLGLAQGSWTARGLARRFGTPKRKPGRTVSVSGFAERLSRLISRTLALTRSDAVSSGGRRLFVSRGTSGKRGIANEPELLAALAPLGFEMVRCETLSISEQAELFASASVVVGPHGAGLTNIVFCGKGTLVVELFNAHLAACFWTISELQGLRHALHFCAPERAGGPRPGSDPGQSAAAVDIRLKPFHVHVDALLSDLHALGVSAPNV